VALDASLDEADAGAIRGPKIAERDRLLGQYNWVPVFAETGKTEVTSQARKCLLSSAAVNNPFAVRRPLKVAYSILR